MPKPRILVVDDYRTRLAREAGAEGYLSDTIEAPALVERMRDALSRSTRA